MEVCSRCKRELNDDHDKVEVTRLGYPTEYAHLRCPVVRKRCPDIDNRKKTVETR